MSTGSSSIIEQSSRQIPCFSSSAQGSRDLLCYYSTTAVVMRTRRSAILMLGARDRVAKSHGNGRFPSHIASALTQSCAGDSIGKFQDRRVLPHSKTRNDLDRPAPATSTRSQCCYLGILSKVVVVGDGSRHESYWKTSLSLSRAGAGNVVAKPHGCSRSMGGGTCTG